MVANDEKMKKTKDRLMKVYDKISNVLDMIDEIDDEIESFAVDIAYKELECDAYILLDMKSSLYHAVAHMYKVSGAISKAIKLVDKDRDNADSGEGGGR